jgi:hypothetical protein
MLVLIVLIGGNYEWCLLVKQAMCRSPKIFATTKDGARPKICGEFFGGADVVLTYLLNGSFYF